MGHMAIDDSPGYDQNFENYYDMIIGHGWMRVMMKIGGDQLCDILDH